MHHASFNHHRFSSPPGLSFSKTFHGAASGVYWPIKINTNTPDAKTEKGSKLVSTAIRLLRGCRGLERLGCNGICFGLYDDGLDDLLFVRVEDLSEVLVELWLFMLELW